MSRDEEAPRQRFDMDRFAATAAAVRTIFKPELGAIKQFDDLVEKLRREPGTNGAAK